ncbi:MAG: fucose isomerase [Anaerolineae bacterium]|nr:fucose isomerase [Anaerolineae bacterium]
MTHLNDGVTQPLRVGLVALARTTFDVPLAEEMAAQARAALERAGFERVGPAGLVTDAAAVDAAADALAADPPDLLIVLQATFADSTMAVRLAEGIDAPLLLWGVPEPLTGGRLRLNAFCGINLAAHALKRTGRRYETVYAPPDDAEALAKVDTLARAGRARRLLRATRIGRVGEHPAGFDSCQFDGPALAHRFGARVVQVSLERVFADARAANADDVAALRHSLGARLHNLDELDPTATEGTLRTFLALRRLAEQEDIAGLAVRCWPEFFTELGCAACGAMSMLSDERTPCSCEVDVNGTLTQVILQSLSGEPAFGTDMVALDAKLDGVVLWHCGLAPLSMADPDVAPRGTIHSNRKLPLLMEFPLKPGPVTVARLSEATGDYRLVIGRGQMVRAPLRFSGTSGVLRFDRPAAQVLETLLAEGLEHHISITYGDHTAALEALAGMLELPILYL